MNRLIFMGNSFDLAHNLKTSYKDFIEYLWKGIFEELRLKMYETNNSIIPNAKPNECFEFIDNNKLIKLEYRSNEYKVLKNVLYVKIYSKHKEKVLFNLKLDEADANNLLLDNLKDLINIYDNYFYSYDAAYSEFEGTRIDSYINKFFRIISQSYINKNWSDIESDYYNELLKFKNQGEYQQKYINELNKQFEQIKELLREYLKSLGQPTKIDKLESIIYEPIKYEEMMIGRAFARRKIGLEIIVDLEKILLLNFNYTQTEKLYVKNNIQVNHIHGSLDEASNHMIFGYGDEEADEYKELEKLDYKGLLDNVKSINYLEASNYRDMERFIESDQYQIFIMGMSCGMADRTMLGKLFQHDKCVSIKPFYYQRKDKDGNITGDNYTEIVQNISRCFSNKDLLRSVVVNKPNCEALPQHNDK